MKTRSLGHAGWLMLLVVVAGCATAPPAELAGPVDAVTPGEARAAPEQHVGRTVRWGGTVARVENLSGETRVEVVSRDLDSGGRPRDEDRSDGRFLALFDGFLDPAIVSNGREITVVGALVPSVSRTIGAYPYRFPVVKVARWKLWSPRPEVVYREYAPHPYWYDPWYPWRRYPYWW